MSRVVVAALGVAVGYGYARLQRRVRAVLRALERLDNPRSEDRKVKP